jgi:hypothetical protein
MKVAPKTFFCPNQRNGMQQQFVPYFSLHASKFQIPQQQAFDATKKHK